LFYKNKTYKFDDSYESYSLLTFKNIFRVYGINKTKESGIGLFELEDQNEWPLCSPRISTLYIKPPTTPTIPTTSTIDRFLWDCRPKNGKVRIRIF
jgi:hypothetical protein